MSARLDEFARALASEMPRRRALGVLFGLAAGAAVPALRPAVAGAVSSCPQGETFCQCPSVNGLFYEECCMAGEKCSCIPPPGGAAVCSLGCPSGKRCGSRCCHHKRLCCNGRCCPRGGKCCYEDHCCKKDETCCGQECCPAGQACCGDHCCPTKAACCGNGCCANGHDCVQVRGREFCCPDRRVLITESDTFCCPRGTVARGDRCCPVKGSCTPCEPACPAGQICNDGYCLQPTVGA